MNKRRVIFDCDPGHDDVVAILLALASEEMEIVGIVTSAGNQTVEKTTTNTLKLLSYLNFTSIPVVKGLGKPLCQPLICSPEVHGETGLDGADLGEIKFDVLDKNPVEFMFDTIMRSDEKTTLIVTGPMTNTAALLLAHPEVKEKIECISFMGGACFGGNKTPLSEFNIYVDPEAAKIVFKSGIELFMSGLDVTMKARLLKKDINAIRSLNNGIGPILADLLDFFNLSTTVNFLVDDENYEEGVHMHDPCAVAILLHPEKFVTRKLYGDVETSGEYSRGCTVIDYDDLYHREKNVTVAFDLDRDWFAEFVVDSVGKL